VDAVTVPTRLKDDKVMRMHFSTFSRLALVASISASRVFAQGPPPDGQPPMVELTGSWTMVNDEERLVRIEPRARTRQLHGLSAERRWQAEGVGVERDDPGSPRASVTRARRHLFDARAEPESSHR